MAQRTYKHTTEDIRERTSLPRHFIDKCSSKLSDFLDPYRQYGNNNQLFYSDNGLKVFDHIGQLKREGKTIPEIRATLENELRNQQDAAKSDRKASQNPPKNRRTKTEKNTADDQLKTQLIEALQESNRQVQKAKDEVIKSKDETISSLRQNLKLITDGRDPKEVQREHEEKIKEAAEKEQKIRELQKEKDRQKKRERRRQQLLAELKSLEGKWFKSSRRREIIAELERLDRLDAKKESTDENGS
ncbi:MAG: hypothetical protein ABEL04_08625 [Salinibacter sp.]|uniref:hypothetical protein n=1 Tax=Salinibacter sp. TaxID=2065818 RepID=UPI0035D42267